jgi:DNA-directed RNA polymerase specialized sigma24 family protein
MNNPFSDDFISRYREGDEGATIELWEYGKKYCVPFLCYLGFSFEDAQDIWYETHFNFFEGKCPTFDPTRGPFCAWLHKVVKNVALYELRKRNRFPCEQLDDSQDVPSPNSIG